MDTSTPLGRDLDSRKQAIATVRNPRIRAAPSTRKGHSRLAPVGWTYTFLYCEENLGLAIPPLAAQVKRRRKPVPAPKPVGAAPRTAVPAAVYP